MRVVETPSSGDKFSLPPAETCQAQRAARNHYLVAQLNDGSFLTVPGCQACPAGHIACRETSNRVILCGARLGLLITFELMVCLVRPCYSVVPGLPCWPLVATTLVSLGVLRSTRFVLRSHFELMVCLVRPAGRCTRLALLATRAVDMWYQACLVGHVGRDGARLVLLASR